MTDNESDDLYSSTDIENAIIQGERGTFDDLIDDADLTHRANNGNTLLHEAAGSGRPDIARELIDRGIDLDVQNDGGLTPLLTALEVENYDTAKVLLEEGANPNVFDNNGRCALSMAVTRGQRGDKLKMLLEHGADPTASDQSGESVLEWLRRIGKTDVAELMVSYAEE
ncbi:ankyrin repeat domain-containing protein [Natrinema pallidum]|uniref:Ankyrin repeat-containing protein n=1 Tax=Natrinema pallidum DSM 3751 TaxID=1227495 RepID=L9YYN1_9EURY|nr:ankyrin repeat domain-containing protein [Natrinema pallidum]ELY78751.1 ankyrin repeat-containing protein [Natrinema pallidum DSM 3751]